MTPVLDNLVEWGATRRCFPVRGTRNHRRARAANAVDLIRHKDEILGFQTQPCDEFKMRDKVAGARLIDHRTAPRLPAAASIVRNGPGWVMTG